MTEAGEESRGVTAVRVVSSVLALWAAAASIEITAQRWERVLARLGDDLPVPTAWTIAGARLDLAWGLAAAGTAVLAVLWLRRSRFCADACAASLFVSAIGAAVAALALTLVLDTGPAILRGPSSDGPGPPSRTCESSETYAEGGGAVS